MTLQRKAIFVGTLAGGFDLVGIASNGDDLDQMINDAQRPGQHAEALEIKSPKDRLSRHREYEEGSDYILFGSATGGVEIFGPFPDTEIANDFAERARHEDEEWELHSA